MMVVQNSRRKKNRKRGIVVEETVIDIGVDEAVADIAVGIAVDTEAVAAVMAVVLYSLETLEFQDQ